MKRLVELLCVFIYASCLVSAEQGSRSLTTTQSTAVPAEKISTPTRTKPIRYRYLSIKDFKNQKLRAVSAHGRDDNNNTSTGGHSRLRVAFRALYLFIIFSPAIISAPLAYIIPIFRRYIWFKLLVNIIGIS